MADFISTKKQILLPVIPDKFKDLDDVRISIYKLLQSVAAMRDSLQSTAEYIKRDGTIPLTADWDIGDTRAILTDKVRARDSAGLALYDDNGNGIFVHDGGIIDTAKQSIVSIGYPTKTLTHDAYTKMTGESESFDVQGEWSSNKFTATKAGKYLVHFQLMHVDSDNVFIGAIIYVNNSAAYRGFIYTPSTYRTVAVTALISLAANDYIEFYGYCYNYTDGSNVATYDDASTNFATIMKVA